MTIAANTPEITIAQASEYDHILLIDRSGSMADPSKRYPGKSRWQEVEEYVKGFANYLIACDEDGITLITFSGHVNITDGVKDLTGITSLFRNEHPMGGTNLHLAIDAAMKKVKESSKPAFIHVFTDGEPSDPAAVKASISKAVQSMKKDADLGFNFMQVGDDPFAAKFLNYLDDELQRDLRLPYDAVNAMTVSESENLTPGQILWLALND